MYEEHFKDLVIKDLQETQGCWEFAKCHMEMSGSISWNQNIWKGIIVAKGSLFWDHFVNNLHGYITDSVAIWGMP